MNMSAPIRRENVWQWLCPALRLCCLLAAGLVPFAVPAQGGPPKLACASGGRIRYDPKGSTMITLSGVSGAASCPGEAVSPNQLDVRLE